jgi:hypothetical protein
VFHGKVLVSTEAQKLIERGAKGKGQGVKGKNTGKSFTLDPFPFTLAFMRLTIHINETPSCR